jgi:hypothetical protein
MEAKEAEWKAEWEAQGKLRVAGVCIAGYHWIRDRVGIVVRVDRIVF